jgi:uncharacterized membrane protein
MDSTTILFGMAFIAAGSALIAGGVLGVRRLLTRVGFYDIEPEG